VPASTSRGPQILSVPPARAPRSSAGFATRRHGSRGFTVRDPEGNLWSFGTYRVHNQAPVGRLGASLGSGAKYQLVQVPDKSRLAGRMTAVIWPHQESAPSKASSAARCSWFESVAEARLWPHGIAPSTGSFGLPGSAA
jgi:hypothetical protein